MTLQVRLPAAEDPVTEMDDRHLVHRQNPTERTCGIRRIDLNVRSKMSGGKKKITAEPTLQGEKIERRREQKFTSHSA